MRHETELRFAADHPAFAGHFPGQPLVPGVLLLDAALQAARQNYLPGAAVRCQISAAKFLSPVRPGETLTLSWSRNEKGQTRFEIAGSGRSVATGLFVFETTP